MYNISEDPSEEHLHHLDDEYALENLVVMLFLGVLMTVGIFGNCLVFFVYLTKIKPSTTRCFILALSILDLISCCICIPIDVIDLRHNYTFGRFGMVPCKMSSMLVTFTSFASGHVLVAVAAVQHKKVCYPTGPQTTVRTAKVAVFVSCFAASVMALPSAVLYGGQTTPTDIDGINGSLCTTSDEYVNTPYVLVNNAFQFVIFIAGTMTLTTLYFRIWRKVSKFAQKKLWSWKYSDALSGETSHSSKTEGLESANPNPISETIPVDNNSTFYDRSTDMNTNANFPERGRSIQRRSEPIKCPSKRQMSARRTTWMLFIITLTFVMSYLPHLSLMATRAVHWDVIEGLKGSSLAAYNFFLRSYFINCAVNPVIYSYWNANVREQLKDIVSFKGLRKCF